MGEDESFTLDLTDLIRISDADLFKLPNSAVRAPDGAWFSADLRKPA